METVKLNSSLKYCLLHKNPEHDLNINFINILNVYFVRIPNVYLIKTTLCSRHHDSDLNKTFLFIESGKYLVNEFKNLSVLLKFKNCMLKWQVMFVADTWHVRCKFRLFPDCIFWVMLVSGLFISYS